MIEHNDEGPESTPGSKTNPTSHKLKYGTPTISILTTKTTGKAAMSLAEGMVMGADVGPGPPS